MTYQKFESRAIPGVGGKECIGLNACYSPKPVFYHKHVQSHAGIDHYAIAIRPPINNAPRVLSNLGTVEDAEGSI